MVNVGKYTIHGSYGIVIALANRRWRSSAQYTPCHHLLLRSGVQIVCMSVRSTQIFWVPVLVHPGKLTFCLGFQTPWKALKGYLRQLVGQMNQFYGFPGSPKTTRWRRPRLSSMRRLRKSRISSQGQRQWQLAWLMQILWRRPCRTRPCPCSHNHRPYRPCMPCSDPGRYDGAWWIGGFDSSELMRATRWKPKLQKR